MIAEVVKCDVCGAIRGPENHWFLSCEAEGGVWEDDSHVFGVAIFLWNDTIATRRDVKHICGSACAHVVLGRYLESLIKESV